MTYRVIGMQEGMGRVYRCIQCGIEHSTRSHAEDHAAMHTHRAEHELMNDPEYDPIIKPKQVVVKTRKRRVWR